LIAIATLLFAGQAAWATTPAPPSLIPYTISIFAGGGSTVTYAKGNLCPVSGYVMTDNLGDGCLATEITLKSPWFITQDKNGNYFFSDSLNYSIRRIDGATGIVTLVAGGGTKATVGVACPSGNIPTTTDGDGCLGSEAYLGRTTGVAISPLTGNLYFVDNGNESVHMITATSNCSAGYCYIVPSTTTGNSTGVMTLVAGNPATGQYGYTAGDPTTSTQVVAATGSILDFPEGLWFDSVGNLYIAEEQREAVLAVNTTSAPTTVAGITIPAGDITKISGAFSSTVPTCVNGLGTTGIGCSFTGLATGTAANGKSAITLPIDAPIAMVTDTAGNIYVSETYDNDVYQVSTAGLFNIYAGTRGSKGAVARGLATSQKIGSEYGLGIDPANNLYIVDASYGLIERVDSADQYIYTIGGGGTSTFTPGQACPVGFGTATDTAGDGCPATTVKLTGLAGGYGPSSASTLNSAAILAGLYMDTAGNALVTDTALGVIHKLASGTAFGAVTGTPTQYLEIHFGVGDLPLSGVGAYVITAGATNFTIPSAATCAAANTDGTTDCVLPIKMIATTPGMVTGTLTVTSAAAKVSTFPLSATVVVPVASNTAVTVAGTCPPGGSSTITATVTNSVGLPSGGNVTIYVNGVAIGTPQTLPVSRKVTATYTFPQSATAYNVYATYSGDANDLASTTATQTVTSFYSAPFVLSAGTSSQPSESSVPAGGTALYTVNVSTYLSGQYQFYCSGLPSGAACVFYPPPPVTPTAGTSTCQGSAVVALSVTTTQPKPVIYGFGAYNRNKWTVLGILPAILLAMLVMVRRRKSPLKHSGVLLGLAFLLAMASTMGCGKDFGASAPGTPTGTYYFTVTGVDAAGDTQSVAPPSATPTGYYYTLTVR
jgi:hypothetical protein